MAEPETVSAFYVAQFCAPAEVRNPFYPGF